MFNSLVSEETKNRSAERLKTCAGCEMFDASTSKCKKCGCFMKFKTLIENAKCPLNKWI